VPVTLGAALLAAGVALSLPNPAPALAPSTVQPTPTSVVISGPVGLAEVWPSARAFTVDGTLSSGESFYPVVFVDESTIVGLARTADNTMVRLVVRHGAAAPRVLRVLPIADQSAVATVLVSGTDVFWTETSENDDGQPLTAVWRAGLETGTARRLSLEASALTYFGSKYDLQLAGGRLYWAAYAQHGRSEIRSIPVEGGAVAVRTFDRAYGMTAYPWITSSAGGIAKGDVDMVNLLTGQHVIVPASPNQILSGSPTWCRVTTLPDQAGDQVVTLKHRDGTHAVTLTAHTTPVNTDVALLDRFEVTESASNPSSANSAQRIWLYDLASGRQALLGESTTGLAESSGGFLWWSTGDNEATVFHVVDLRQLT
jgi:hypothetical protein